MLIGDFLSVENFYFLFNHLQTYAREKLNYKFELNDYNKNNIGKLMEVIYENNHSSMDKKSANALILIELQKQLRTKAKKFLDNEEIKDFVSESYSKPFIDFNKPSQILSSKFNSIFKKPIENSEFLIAQSYKPQDIFKDVLKSLEFKEHDLSKPPENIREDFLIPRPDLFKDIFDKPLLIETFNFFLDSRDRNHDLYEDPHNYTIKLDSILKNVISIELLHATIPNSEYLINEYNNIIHFQEINGITLMAEIPIGNYSSGNDIASEIENTMNNIGSSSYTVTYNSITEKFTINSDRTGGDGIFILKFEGIPETFGNITRTKYLSNSIGPIIGFLKQDLSNNNSHTSQQKSNFTPERNIYMYINPESKDSFDNIESIKKTDFGKFMKLDLLSNFGEPTYWINPRAKQRNLIDMYNTNINQIIPEKSDIDIINKNENDYKLVFNPPISINQLQIQFKNYYQEFYDFHGLEHSLLFKIEMFNFHYENIIMDYKFPDDEEN